MASAVQLQDTRGREGIPTWDGDFFVLAEPEAFYAELRRRGPVVRLARYDVLAVGRYAETQEVFSD